MKDFFAEKSDYIKQEISSRFKDSIDLSALEIYVWKHLICIRDIELYHSIGDSLEAQYKARGSDLEFIAELDGQHWTVVLPGKAKLFNDRYGNRHE
jgi:hypothetical protein